MFKRYTSGWSPAPVFSLLLPGYTHLSKGREGRRGSWRDRLHLPGAFPGTERPRARGASRFREPQRHLPPRRATASQRRFPPPPGARGAAGGVAWRGRGPKRGVEGHAASVSWRPPCWAGPGARCGPACPACPACGRAGGGSRGLRARGGAWLQPADPAARAPTATASSCYGERARPPPRAGGEQPGAGGRGVPSHLVPVGLSESLGRPR